MYVYILKCSSIYIYIYLAAIGLRVASVLTIRSKFGIMEKSGKRGVRVNGEKLAGCLETARNTPATFLVFFQKI